jgi:hypothetical protein
MPNDLRENAGIRQNLRLQLRVRLRELAGHPLAEDLDLPPRPLDGDTIGEPPHDPAGRPATPREVERIVAEREPEMVAIREEKSLRHHAHYRVPNAADSNRLADDVRNPAHPREPEMVPDDDDVGRADDFVRRVERASKVRRDAEEGEDRRRDLGAPDRSATSVVREDVVQILPPHREVFERGEFLAPLPVIVKGARDVARHRPVVVAEHHDLFSAFHRERPRERIQDVERQQSDRNADRQRKYRNERQTGLPDQHPDCELHVEPGRTGHR